MIAGGVVAVVAVGAVIAAGCESERIGDVLARRVVAWADFAVMRLRRDIHRHRCFAHRPTRQPAANKSESQQRAQGDGEEKFHGDRKSTRLNSSHVATSY